MAAAEGHTRGICGTQIRGVLGVDPGALSAEAGLKALYTNNGKQKPEEAHQETHSDEERSCLLQTLKDDLSQIGVSTSILDSLHRTWRTHHVAPGHSEQPNDTETAEHAENMDRVSVFQAGGAQGESNPVANDSYEV